MRKLSLFLSTLVLAALLLTACGGEETSTSAPDTNVPPTSVEATATSEVAPGTETVSPTEGTTTPGIPVTGEENPARLSNELDYDVWNQDGDQIGEVDDMVVDLDNTRISYVIVGTGGFLDIGEKEVLVPWDSLQLQTETDAIGGDQIAFVLQADQETFNNAPDTDFNEILPPTGQPAADWDHEIRSYWESGILPNTPSAEGTAMPDVTASSGATAMPEDTVASGVPLQGVMLASELLGSSISLSQNQATAMPEATASPSGTVMPEGTATLNANLGNLDVTDVAIDDVIVDTESGEIQYLVVDANFDDGEHFIPVPFKSLQWDAENEAFIINVNAATLQDAPFFENGEYPDTTVEGWDDEFNAFWQSL